MRRVIAGRLDGAPHETLLVVDATTGQNGVQQARLFAEAVDVTGVALTKLDGSAKGRRRGRDRLRARPAGEARRRGGGARRPAAVRRRRLRACAGDCVRLERASGFDSAFLAELFTRGYEGYFVPVQLDAAAFETVVDRWDVDLASVTRGVRRRRGGRSGEPRGARRARLDRRHRRHSLGAPARRRPGADGGRARGGAAARDARGARAERGRSPAVRAARIRNEAGARGLVAVRRARRRRGARRRSGAARPARSAVAARRRLAAGRLRADRGRRRRGALPRDRRHRRRRTARRSRRRGRPPSWCARCARAASVSPT